MLAEPTIIVAPAESHFVIPVPTGTTNKTPYTFNSGSYRSKEEYLYTNNKKYLIKGSRWLKWKGCNHLKIARLKHRPTISIITSTNKVTMSPRWSWSTRILDDPGFIDGTLPFNIVDPDNGVIQLSTPEQLGVRSVSYPDNVWDLVKQSIIDMQPQIKPQLSLLNTIIELKDFKSLSRSIGKLKEAFNVFSKLTKIGKNTGNRVLRDLVKPIAKGGSDAYLQTQFNILPLLSDITNVFNVSQNVDKQIQNLLVNEGRLRVARYAKSLTDSYHDSSETEISTHAGAMCEDIQWQRDITYTKRPMFRAQMLFSYRLTAYDRANATLLGRLDSLGLGGIRPSIIWNAIPWSFIADWTTGISQWLKNNLDGRALEPITSIHDYLWSFSTARTTVLSCNYRYNTQNPPGPSSSMVPCLTKTEDAYIRVAGYPGDISLALRLSGLSPKEFSLGAALAITRV
jgi:hypothetical protein